MAYIEELKTFVFNAWLLDDTFDRLEKDGLNVKTGGKVIPIERIEETDFSPKIIYDANQMSSVYVAFFCLENAVRELIVDRLAERHGVGWWQKCVPEKIRTAVQKLKDHEEKNKYHTSRSVNLIGYTMFGNLSQIITNNWEDFSDIIPSQSWVHSRFTDLEMSRNIIMHTGVLPAIEIERLESIVRDWIRQVG